MARALELIAEPGGAPVLPDNGVVDGLAGAPVPDHGRLALVGDADRGDVPGSEARLGQRLARDLELGRPNLLRVMLDPPGLGEDLAKLLLGHGDECGQLDRTGWPGSS